jgi:hypothetical protein
MAVGGPDIRRRGGAMWIKAAADGPVVKTRTQPRLPGRKVRLTATFGVICVLIAPICLWW